MTTVAQALAGTLAAYGTDTYFCLTGGDHALWVALKDEGIRIVNCRSEASAAYMADGYARVSGRPGFVYGQRGPGVANVAAAMADPFWAMSPVVSLTTSIALRSRDRYEYQELDGLAMHAPLMKWNKTVSAPHRMAAMVRSAIRIATGPVPGPVHLEVPADMLALDAGDEPLYREEQLGRINARRLTPNPDEVGTLLDLLAKAERPLIVAGNGVIISEAWEELTRLAELLAIPVATTLGGKGSISEIDSDLAVGVIGRYSRRVANECVREADLILAIGTRLGGLATHGWQLPFGSKTLLQIDTDPSIIGLNFRTQASVVGDAKLTLAALIAEVSTRKLGRPRTPWAGKVAADVAAWRIHADQLRHERPADGIHPADVIASLRDAMGPDDLLAADTGAIAAWAGTLFHVPMGRKMIRATGSLGWVLPGAMGAALAAPHRRTVALSGDGGLLYHIGDLETAMRCNIPIVIVVMNNRAFGSEYHLQQHHKDGRIISEIIDFYDSDFSAVARGFGAHGVRVTRSEDIPQALRDAFAANKPALVEIMTSKEVAAPSASYRDGMV